MSAVQGDGIKVPGRNLGKLSGEKGKCCIPCGQRQRCTKDDKEVRSKVAHTEGPGWQGMAGRGCQQDSLGMRIPVPGDWGQFKGQKLKACTKVALVTYGIKMAVLSKEHMSDMPVQWELYMPQRFGKGAVDD